MDELVIDTNVLILANARDDLVDDHNHLRCVLACTLFLRDVESNGRVHLDSSRLILAEYTRYCSYSGQPGTGDRFFLWLHNNQANEDRVCWSDISESASRGFDEFPDVSGLIGFDMDDRKFVATSRACSLHPTVANATD